MRFQGLTKGKIMKRLVRHTKGPGLLVDSESDHHIGLWERFFSLKWDKRVVGSAEWSVVQGKG